MKGRLFFTLAVWMGLLAASLPVFAHHGQANYDMAKMSTVKGTVTSFQFKNPHMLVYLDVKTSSGTVEKWVVEGASPNMLVRQGWNKNTLKPGDQITVTGHPARNGTNSMRIEKLVMANGRKVTLDGPGE
jgi:DNA/RNA endonuclease YhcR with UshA esterase domain